MIDLHIHSLYSDGTSTTSELVRMDMEKNMKMQMHKHLQKMEQCM